MKNNFEVRGDVTVIFIRYKGEMITTTISTKDFHRVNAISGTWTGSNVARKEDDETVYVHTKVAGVTVYLHQVVANNPPKTVVDHRNHNTLDNTKGNLNVVDHASNSQNRKGASKNNKSSGYRNVYQNKNGTWFVQLGINGKDKRFGTYQTIEEADRVAKEVRKRYFYDGKDVNHEIQEVI
ncbi:AP2 domain-containing protein [Marinococcus halophilus]|uniref:Uncharacterized protein n=1 Tax=Marinococcus halophilus TaxID=1371 RepID=A0A510Y1F8_MARHA|nr:AP2 domain-containing protein [Marinococcus halophilus]GEK57152.1 hypothetical protein MHA01_00570 [Marinococcus halophilus]